MTQYFSKSLPENISKFYSMFESIEKRLGLYARKYHMRRIYSSMGSMNWHGIKHYAYTNSDCKPCIEYFGHSMSIVYMINIPMLNIENSNEMASYDLYLVTTLPNRLRVRKSEIDKLDKAIDDINKSLIEERKLIEASNLKRIMRG